MDSKEELKRHLLKMLQMLHKLENINGAMCIPIAELQVRLIRCYQLLFPKEKRTIDNNIEFKVTKNG